MSYTGNPGGWRSETPTAEFFPVVQSTVEFRTVPTQVVKPKRSHPYLKALGRFLGAVLIFLLKFLFYAALVIGFAVVIVLVVHGAEGLLGRGKTRAPNFNPSLQS